MTDGPRRPPRAFARGGLAHGHHPAQIGGTNESVNLLDRRWRTMAVTSTMLELGTRAPDFALPDTDGRTVSLGDFADAPALLVIFLSNHCPFVKHLHRALAELARDYQPRGVAVVGIMSNDVARFPADAPERMREQREAWGWTFPYLYDEGQQVARAHRAACTPDIFLFDGDRRLVYR